MLKTTVFAATFALAATGASAFELKNTQAYIGLDRLSTSGADLTGVNLGIDTTAMISDRFGLDLGFGIARPDDELSGFDNMVRLSVAGNYYFSSNAYVGAFVDATRFSDSSNSETATVYGIQGGYSTDTIAITAYYGVGDYDDLGAPEKSDTYGAEFVYSLQNGLDLGAYYQGEKLSGTDIKQYGLTAGYRFGGEASSMPIYLVGTLGRLDIDGIDTIDQFSLAVSIPLGGGNVTPGRKAFHKRSAFHNVFGIAGSL